MPTQTVSPDARPDGDARLRLLVEQVPAILWTTDADLRITSLLGAGLATLGRVPAQFNARSLYDIFDTTDPDLPPIAAHRRALAGQPCGYERSLTGRTYQCHVEPLRDPAGAITGVAGIALDVTERKAAEEALRQARDELENRVRERTSQLEAANASLHSEVAERRAAGARLREALASLRQNEQRLAGILNAQQTLVSRSDAGGRLTYVNAAHARIFGSEVGDSMLVRVHPEDVEQTVAAMESLRHPPHTCTLEQRVEVRGEWRTFLWQGGVIRDDAGRIAEYQAVGFDITDRRRAEEALRASERRARELARRERESAERERQAAQQAREAAEFSRRLVREVDHRVRNNLAGLLGLVQAMRDKGASVQDFAHNIEGRLLAMSNVHHLLADAGWRAVELRTLVTSLLAAVERMGCHPVPVTAEGPAVSVSPRQAQPLSMIMLEWFTNSCKYGAHSVPAGQVRVTWEVVPEGERPWVHLRWQESNGPPVRAPAQRSLGTDLVRGFASLELKGRCDLQYPPTGADHRLEFPVE